MLKRSFAPVVDPATRVLVLGSLPGDRSLAERRYYAHPQNQFWRLIGSVFDRDLAALDYSDRLALLLAAGVGLWDVVATAHRPGSTDAAIRDLATNDLIGLTRRLPALGAIAFNGGKSLAIGTRALAGAVPHVARVALPSSSPLHTVGLAAKLPAWLALRHYL
ncbi:DNA-deoxyinosine glycosylase [Sphingomonas oligophenolica]|uniref:DNA-deoxyinosine glycosylase n=1 Tax=Sphingomonas oligophenolica TaxID=301154 RepID=A0A502CHW9_9SPHN|nr:DNA-deoxyinosine glycosylase [Sphingomonas oligophenolica]TPG13235.1 DNA-deoxyinosine glycosylase [Sphingomonas oligophenolica]